MHKILPSISLGRAVAFPKIGFFFGPGIRSIVFTYDEFSHLWWPRNRIASKPSTSKMAAKKASHMTNSNPFLNVNENIQSHDLLALGDDSVWQAQQQIVNDKKTKSDKVTKITNTSVLELRCSFNCNDKILLH